MRTRLEWEEELQALRDLETQISAEIEGDDDIEGALRAQINVIDAILTKQQIYELYDEDEFVLNAALDAYSWLRDDGESPAQYWRTEVLTAA